MNATERSDLCHVPRCSYFQLMAKHEGISGHDPTVDKGADKIDNMCLTLFQKADPASSSSPRLNI